MKGISILKEIDKPVEGMRVLIWPWSSDGRIWKIVHIAPKADPEFQICIEAGLKRTCARLSTLRQINIEYEHIEHFNKRPTITIRKLPLHSDDYGKALPLMGKEVEFDIKMESRYNKKQEDRYCKFIDEFDTVKTAKLIAPAPIIYTEKEAKSIAREAARIYSDGMVEDTAFDTFWNQHKKK